MMYLLICTSIKSEKKIIIQSVIYNSNEYIIKDYRFVSQSICWAVEKDYIWESEIF